MLTTSTVWEERFDRITNILQWVALAFGAVFAFLQEGATLPTAAAFSVAGIYIVIFQSLPHRMRHNLWVGEILAVGGVGASILAVALTGGTDSPYLLLSVTPVLYSAAFSGWRRGIETGLLASGALAAVRGLVQDSSLLGGSLWAWVAVYLLMSITFSYARQILLEVGATTAALLEDAARASARIERLEASNQLLTALSDLADGAELNPVQVGQAALAHLQDVLPFDAGQVVISGDDGPVVVARTDAHHEFETTLTAPLTVGSREVGFVVLSRPTEFSPNEVATVLDAVQPAALSFANILLLQDIARRAIKEERVRLARELHDEIGPSLASLGLALDLAALQNPGDPALADQLGGLRSNVTKLVDEVRETVTGLREADPISLYEHALIIASDDPDQLPKVTVALREHRPPPPAIGVEIAAIMTEAVRNARNHSGAHIVTVEGFVNRDEGEVVITDDGVGFDSSSEFEGHYGLIGMRERAAKVGGEIAISSSPVGTSISVAWSKT
jgi:signal transduction histidine kinase